MPSPTATKTKLLLSYIAFTSTFLTLLSLSFILQPPSLTPNLTSPHRILKHADIDDDDMTKTTTLITNHCQGTLYPDLCFSTLSTIPNLRSKSLPEIICSALNNTQYAVRKASANCSTYLSRHHYSLDSRQILALTDCLELFDGTLDEIHSAYSALSSSNASARVADIQTVLSAAIANQYTCLDGFAYVDGNGYRSAIQGKLLHVSHLVSNSLSMLKRIRRRYLKGTQRREAFEGYGEVDDGGFPEWVGARERRLLDSAVGAVNLTVAKDGSGNFTTIGDAVAAAPNNSATRYVIYVKAGAYFENVEVGKNKINLMMVGDGIGKTVVKANRSVVGGWTTFRSATVAVTGNGFIMRDITIENSAGPSNHQAVALRVGADLSAFYKCSFVGYQDTLYVHSLRQFYRDCDIYGTVDFIFGDAAVVFQNCNLYARRPLANQKNIFTAQGREDPNETTGISIQKCKVTAASDLIPVQSNFSTYLGRPWKEYSRTVFMESFLDSLINPAGWLEWNGTFALDTLYYAEYKNRGPGANTTNRVDWSGYKVITSAAEASNFTVASFIQGGEWLGATGVPFVLGLS